MPKVPLIILLVLIVILHSSVLFALADTADPSITRSQDVNLNAGDLLIITSNRTSIQKVLVEGNVSDRILQTPQQYPTNSFAIGSSGPGIYILSIFFDYPSDYQIDLFVERAGETGTTNSSTYYVSSGSLELDVNANFSQLSTPPTAITLPSQTPPWQSFASWLSKFGEAFPLWVKLVYLVLGIQFLTVGGLWIRREAATKDTETEHHDTGDRVFLWVDVACKFLLVSFLTIVAVMGGEALALFILRFMFLVSLNLLSLWDLFVVGFAGSAAVIAYLFRFTLEKAFDLKPMQDE